MNNKMLTPRNTAYNILKKVYNKNAFSNIEMMNIDDRYDSREQRFVKALVFGVLERHILLEYILKHFVNKKTDREVLLLLETGLQQILFMNVPDSAACNETVSLAKLLFDKQRAGFINAVLRNIVRNKDKLNEYIKTAPPHILYSVSKSVYDLLKIQFGENTEKILKAFYDNKPLFIRINNLISTADSILESLKEKGAEAFIVSEKTLGITNHSGVVLDNINSGEFFIQGLSSQKAVTLLGAQEGHTVIDVCACPGGKSIGAAIDMSNRGRIFSIDIHKNKLSLIDNQAEILGINIIKTMQYDSREVNDDFKNIADRVICDVPCSGLGVIGSKPEIRYKNIEDLTMLYKTQAQILRSSFEYLKPGGIMVYSTCTLNRRENEDIVSDFIHHNNKAKLIAEKTDFPYEDTGEGFYTAKLEKI